MKILIAVAIVISNHKTLWLYFIRPVKISTHKLSKTGYTQFIKNMCVALTERLAMVGRQKYKKMVAEIKQSNQPGLVTSYDDGGLG